jgi:RNA polymerase sigma-70 factor (ECF subfamily)
MKSYGEGCHSSLDLDVLTVIMNGMNDFRTPMTPPDVTFGVEDRRFVYAVARRIVGREQDAEDVTQDALLLAYSHRDSFRGDSRYRTWLYRIAATTALGHLRKQRRSRLRLAETERDDPALVAGPDPAKSASVLIEEAEDRARLNQAIDQLAPAYRDVLLARAEATENEVANRLGLTVSNVKIRAHRARKQLRELLENMEQPALAA